MYIRITPPIGGVFLPENDVDADETPQNDRANIHDDILDNESTIRCGLNEWISARSHEDSDKK